VRQPAAIRLWLAGQSGDSKSRKAREVAIGGEKLVDAMLAADGGDLGVEDEIATDSARDACLIEGRGNAAVGLSNRSEGFHELGDEIQRSDSELGGSKTLKWVTTRTNSARQKTAAPRCIGFSDSGDFLEAA